MWFVFGLIISNSVYFLCFTLKKKIDLFYIPSYWRHYWTLLRLFFFHRVLSNTPPGVLKTLIFSIFFFFCLRREEKHYLNVMGFWRGISINFFLFDIASKFVSRKTSRKRIGTTYRFETLLVDFWTKIPNPGRRPARPRLYMAQC